jgi:type II restriction enzyme
MEAVMTDPMVRLLTTWRTDPQSSYQTWFLGSQRIKSFRSVRQGLLLVSARIDAGTFGNAFNGSPLAVVVRSIAQQGHFLIGPERALPWRPKTRTPDIYENSGNQRLFGCVLEVCLRSRSRRQVIAAIERLAAARIKGIGPVVVNLLYFLRPTLLPPYSENIVSGYNILTGEHMKPGRWPEYLAMRERLLAMNHEYRFLLSEDLGAIGSLLFDLGTGRYSAPPRTDKAEARETWEADLLRKVREGSMSTNANHIGVSHTEVQGWLRDLGWSLGYDVWIPANDRCRELGSGMLGDRCLTELSGLGSSVCAEVIRMIDVLWTDRSSGLIVAAFEVEHTTCILTGAVRLLTLAFGSEPHAIEGLFVVAPDSKLDEVEKRLSFAVFRRHDEPKVRYLPYGELQTNRLALGRFGTGVKAIRDFALTFS